MSDPAPLDYTAAPDKPAVRLDRWYQTGARISAAIACIAVAAGAFNVPYFAGRANHDVSMNTILAVVAAALAGVLACGVTLLIAVVFLVGGQFRQARQAFCWLLLPLALAGGARLIGPSDYESGFRGWVQNHIDPQTEQAIAAWDTGLPPSTLTQLDNLSPFDPPGPAETPQSQWPPAIARLAPHRVTRLADGVVMEWGSLGTWGTSRRVLIARRPPTTFTDNSGLFRYTPARPAVWLAIQDGG